MACLRNILPVDTNAQTDKGSSLLSRSGISFNSALLFFTACSDDCSVGLMQCYEDLNGQEVCCSFYDIDNNCVSECGLNQSPDEDFVCRCTASFTPPGNCTGEHTSAINAATLSTSWFTVNKQVGHAVAFKYEMCLQGYCVPIHTCACIELKN